MGNALQISVQASSLLRVASLGYISIPIFCSNHGQTPHRPLQIWFLGYSYLADPFFWLNTFFGTGGSLNDGNYGQTPAQKAVQQELATAATNTNPQQRTQQYNDAEQKIVNDVGWIPLVQAGLDTLINPKVQNLGAAGPTRTWSDVYIAA